MATMLWRPDSRNTKTGPIPQGYVGATRQETEESCKGCPMRRRNKSTGKGGGCYFWNGQATGAQTSMQRRAAERPAEYTLDHALNFARRTANYVRGAVGGDPCIFTRDQVKGWHNQTRAAGLRGLLLYTHFFDTKGSHLKHLAMASVDTLGRADKAVESGWKAAVTIRDRKAPGSRKPQLKTIPEWDGKTYTTPAGREVPLCPAQISNKDCNTCGWCDPRNYEAPPIVGFLIH